MFLKCECPHLWTARLPKPPPQDPPARTPESNSNCLRDKNIQMRIPVHCSMQFQNYHLCDYKSSREDSWEFSSERVDPHKLGPDKIHSVHRNNASETEKRLPIGWDQWQSLPERTPEAKQFCLRREQPDGRWASQVTHQTKQIQCQLSLETSNTRLEGNTSYAAHSVTAGGVCVVQRPSRWHGPPVGLRALGPPGLGAVLLCLHYVFNFPRVFPLIRLKV